MVWRERTLTIRIALTPIGVFAVAGGMPSPDRRPDVETRQGGPVDEFFWMPPGDHFTTH